MAHHFTVKETAIELSRLQRRSPATITARIKMLRHIESGVTSPSLLAKKVNVTITSIVKWKRLYRKAGLDALLKYERGGKRHGGLTDHQHQKLKERLSDPKGAFTSYVEAAAWINEAFGVNMGYHSVNKYLKRNFGTKLKVGRKFHIQKDEEAVAFFKRPVDAAKTH